MEVYVIYVDVQVYLIVSYFFQLTSRMRGGGGVTVQQLRGFAAADLPKHTRVALPALSPTMEMGTIVRYVA
jgi:hypothetical protein